MALLKRRKKPKSDKPLPGREVRCWKCGASVLTDDNPGTPHPPYTCPNCGASHPPTRDQEAARLRELEEAARHAAAKRGEIAKRKGEGLRTISIEPRKTTPEQRAAARQAKESGERMINEILSMDSREQPPGRKSDPAYDKADYRVKVAEICGRKIPTSTLAREVLPEDKSREEYKADKLRQALKRRKRKP